LDSDVFRVPPGYNAPQQVHITQGDRVGKGVIVSWVTQDEAGSNTVIYWSENTKQKKQAEGKVYTYKFYNYTSGYIHHCTIRNLEFNTKYYYVVGIGHTERTFWFTTPPEVGPDVPYTFGLIGDLGQSFDSNSTLTHYEMNPRKGQTLLFVGDLSYADNYPNHDNVRWDTWGRFVERSVAYQPWIWTVGNHEIDFAPEIGETKPFKPYTQRYHVPYRASESPAPFAYGKYTPQYELAQGGVSQVNRSETPWLIVLMHSPCPVKDQSAPVYITIGDGGNLEGLATNMTEPQPPYSAYREASFGHAIFDIKTELMLTIVGTGIRMRYAVDADSMWFFNRYWHPMDDSTTADA
ncbi:Purple acid phosphatase, partial [Melia azedarach]